jgi:hypothetical protein
MPGTTGTRNTRGWLAPARVLIAFYPKPRAKKYNPVCDNPAAGPAALPAGSALRGRCPPCRCRGGDLSQRRRTSRRCRCIFSCVVKVGPANANHDVAHILRQQLHLPSTAHCNRHTPALAADMPVGATHVAADKQHCLMRLRPPQTLLSRLTSAAYPPVPGTPAVCVEASSTRPATYCVQPASAAVSAAHRDSASSHPGRAYFSPLRATHHTQQRYIPLPRRTRVCALQTAAPQPCQRCRKWKTCTPFSWQLPSPMDRMPQRGDV